MARARRVSSRPWIVGAARRAIREGETREDVIAQMGGQFPGESTRTITSIVDREIEREESRQQLREMDNRRQVDLSDLAGCRRGQGTVTVNITVPVVDQSTGATRRYNVSVRVRSQGRLRDILNEAAAAAGDAAREKGYDPRTLRGVGKYTANIGEVQYVEC